MTTSPRSLRRLFLTPIEPLEARNAPATVFTFTDIDGDKATLKISADVNESILVDSLLFSNANSDSPRQMRGLEIPINQSFSGASISITAVRAGGGVGLVNVGFINAAGVDLGAVTI